MKTFADFLDWLGVEPSQVEPQAAEAFTKAVQAVQPEPMSDEMLQQAVEAIDLDVEAAPRRPRFISNEENLNRLEAALDKAASLPGPPPQYRQRQQRRRTLRKIAHDDEILTEMRALLDEARMEGPPGGTASMRTRVFAMMPEINELCREGWSYRAIAERLRDRGIDIATGTFQGYVREYQRKHGTA